MTYSVIVTILLIVVLVLFIVSLHAGMTLRQEYERQVGHFKDSLDKSLVDVRFYQRHAEHARNDNNRLKEALDEEHQRVLSGIDRVHTQRERLKFLREKNNKLSDELMMVSDLMHVKFTAMLPGGAPTKTVFKLGLGPCGLFVKSLRWTELEDRYLIDQLCTNGERKQFTYFKTEVVGRIEFRYGQS